MNKTETFKKNFKAVGKYVRMSPTKVRRVLNLIRGCSYQEASLILNFLPYKASVPIWYILNSAANNAQSSKKKNDLMVAEAYVDKGPILKRARPRAKGRSYAIQKPTCHITIVVE